MRVLQSILTSLLLAASACADIQRTVDVFAWPLSASAPQALAQISYGFPSLNATVTSYTPFAPADSHDIVRVGYNHPSGSWSGVATSPSSFGPALERRIRLHVDSAGELYHIGFTVIPAPAIAGKGQKGLAAREADASAQILVEVVKQTPAPKAVLSKPVVLNEEGRSENPEADQKSFIAKYWYIIAAVLLFQVFMAGGDK